MEYESVVDSLIILRDKICGEICKFDEKFNNGEYTEEEIEKICDECPVYKTL